jgi:hypothetical protein
MSQYSRNNPDEPIRHDWFVGAQRSTMKPTITVLPTRHFIFEDGNFKEVKTEADLGIEQGKEVDTHEKRNQERQQEGLL